MRYMCAAAANDRAHTHANIRSNWNNLHNLMNEKKSYSNNGKNTQRTTTTTTITHTHNVCVDARANRKAVSFTKTKLFPKKPRETRKSEK